MYQILVETQLQIFEQNWPEKDISHLKQKKST